MSAEHVATKSSLHEELCGNMDKAKPKRDKRDGTKGKDPLSCKRGTRATVRFTYDRNKSNSPIHSATYEARLTSAQIKIWSIRKLERCVEESKMETHTHTTPSESNMSVRNESVKYVCP